MKKLMIVCILLITVALVGAEEQIGRILTQEDYQQKWDEQDMIRSHKDNAWHKSEYRKLEKMYKKDLGSELYETYGNFDYVSSRLYTLERIELVKDVDNNGKILPIESQLYKTRNEIYNVLPEKRAYWYGTLDKIKAEDEEIYDIERIRMSATENVPSKKINLNNYSIYEYKRNLREGARGDWENLEKHVSSGERLEKELDKVDKQIDRKVKEIEKLEKMLLE